MELGLKVLTRNLFLGADLKGVYESFGDGIAGVPAAVAAVREIVRATDFARRAVLIGREVAEHAPDLVAVQEAAAWEVRGGATEDHLQLLLAAMPGYRTAVQLEVGNVELPSSDGTFVRLRNRLAILARDSLDIATTTTGTFRHNLPIRTPLGDFELTRGWVAVDAGGLRLITTHLEVGGGEGGQAQQAQAREVIAVADELQDPVVVTGDFNGRPGTPSYNAMLAAGFMDALAGQDAFTCCHAIPLDDPESRPGRRIDHIFARGVQPHDAAVVDTFDGLWASDHAGVIASV